MYRIELAPGEETVFRTIEELAVAARNGLVTPRCRIYHNASQKWLPIEFHPHYKKALSLPAARVAEAVAPRTSGHPPPLETLSFAVAAAAKSAPAPEPVAEPEAETRAADHPGQAPAQVPPQAERSAQEPSVTKRPAGVQRIGQQGAELQGAERSDVARSRSENSAKDHAGTARSGAEHQATAHSRTQSSATSHSPKEDSGAEHSTKKHPAAKHSGAKHSGPKHSAAEHSDAERSGAEHSGAGRLGADHLDARYSGAEHPVTGHAVTKHAVEKHAATGRVATQHSVTEHSVPKHPATDHAPTNHSSRDQAATTHSVVLYTAADEIAAQAAVEHRVEDHPSAEESPTEHRFAPHADMAAESPIQAEPAPAPKSNSSYRSDSYLPSSARVIADDPHVAIAPEPAAAPPVPAAPRRSWSMMPMPAEQETPELPTISYPEITPAQEPVAERASSSRGHRRLQVAVAVLVLAAGGYLARSFYSPVRGSHVGVASSAPAAAVADRPSLPENTPAPIPTAVTTKPSPDRPAVVTPTAPASSGFAAALEPRAIASGPPPILPAHPGAAEASPAASTADSTAVAPIAPAPVEMPMDVPALPGGDSLVAQPRTKGDSAMKKILRAVNGGKDAQ
jgi:hypothetical protein